MPNCLIGLGSNQGDCAAQLAAAVEHLRQTSGIDVQFVSGWVRTRSAGGPPGQNDFLNGAVLIRTALSPREVLNRLQQIERLLGREPAVRWSQRTIDLDILLYDDLVTDSPALTIPHPRLSFRWFALAPAAEIAPEWRHPLSGWTLAQLLQHLERAPNYVALCGLPRTGKTWLVQQMATQLGAVAIDRQPSIGSDWAGVDAELMLIRQRAAAIRAAIQARADASADATWVLSDFWLGQSLAYAAAASDAACEQVSHELTQAAYDGLEPKFVVSLQRRPGEDERALAAALEQLVRSPRVGPLLQLDADQRQWNMQELAAALEAAQVGQRCP